MAHSRNVLKAPESQGNAALVSDMLTGVGAVDDGEWIDVLHYGPFSIDLIISDTAVAQIRGSNALTKPADTAHERQIDVDISASAIIEVTMPVRWIKVRVSGWTSGTIDAFLVGKGFD